jgi:hypothetical protein
MSIPYLPMGWALDCSGCPHLTHINASRCRSVVSYYTPVVNYNNEEYLYYISERSAIISTFMSRCNNYECGVVNIITDYL